MKKTRILSPFPKPKVWRRGRAYPVRREVAVLDRPPLAQIDIYDECVIVTRRKRDGTWLSYPVDPHSLTMVLGKMPSSSGLLPPSTLATGTYQGHPWYVQYISPRVANLQVEENGRLELRQIMTPPLIWCGWQKEYRIWATTMNVAPHTAGDLRSLLYVAPFPNVYNTGRICWGNTSLRPADPQQMVAMFGLFLEESVFNTHIANGKSTSCPTNILRLYDTLAPNHPYPLDDLIQAQSPPIPILGRVVDGSWLKEGTGR